MQPLVFEPYLRPQIWGGRALADRLGKTLPPGEAFGESWEVSVHPHHLSRVAEGAYQGKTLAELCAEHPREIFGDHVPENGKFPLLIKFLDCHELLSVQVHPSDKLAERLAPGERGKTEAWVVLDSAPTGKIYAGLREGVDVEQFRKHVEAQTTDQCLHSFTPRPGDCIFIPAGTVHTMGGGVLLAEVQQDSDATFRIFDWNRKDAQGRSRALHIAESLESIDFDAGPVSPVRSVPLPSMPEGILGERLVDCPYFILERFEFQGRIPQPRQGELTVALVVKGSAKLTGPEYAREFRRGQTLLFPASCREYSWQTLSSSQSATLLCIRLPS